MMGVSNPTTITPQGVAMKGNCCNCSAFVKATSILHRASTECPVKLSAPALYL